MKSYLKHFAIVLTTLTFIACSNDDDSPEPVNEEEVITTLTVTLTPNGPGNPIIMQSRDLDGDGPDAPVVTVSGELSAGTTYSGSIVLLNETETPAENITEEVEEEAEEHQFFFVPQSSLDVDVSYGNFDANGEPLGTEFELVANTASTGNLTIILRHEPTKPNNGTPADAGGETDISVTFSVEIL